ncbi:hypothetical protein HWD94_03985 [Pseudarthrobacter equi]|uniref:hypothetical protein n=1 Tax=Pseudarthrobacter equi TaxID=728066 RepID=UPI0021BF273C|nr:hypothetical protein [Pseudarthrobacter equi]MCT9624283.1 hypothetical protein [Pseudarthrobacter equi]
MTTPLTFNIDAWLDNAERPSRSVTVYQKPGLIAELDILEEQIVNAEAEEVDGPAAGGGTGKLRAKYQELAKQFHDSALTVRVQSLTDREQIELLEGHHDDNSSVRGAIVMAEAITEPKMTPEQVQRFNTLIGEAQFSRVVTAWNNACKVAPAVSADFLLKLSTRDAGGE